MNESSPDLPAPAGRRRRIVIGLFVVALLVVGGLYARSLHLQQTNGRMVEGGVSVLDAQIENLDGTVRLHEKRIEALEERFGQKDAQGDTPKSSPKPPETSIRQTPGGPVANAGDGARIDALEKEVATLRAEGHGGSNIGNASQAIRILSSFHRMNDKILEGKPFASELAAFEEEIGGEEAGGKPLATLAPYAEGGVPTFETLLSSFYDASDEVNATEATPPDNAGFWERLRYNFGHLVRIRKIDEAQTGNSTAAILGRAQAHLENQEVEAAVSELHSLPEASKAAFANWLEDAGLVLDTPTLLAELEERVMEKAFGDAAKSPPSAENK